MRRSPTRCPPAATSPVRVPSQKPCRRVTYGPDDVVRTVTVHGSISWQGRRHFISRGLVGEPVALRPTAETASGRSSIAIVRSPPSTCDHPDEV